MGGISVLFLMGIFLALFTIFIAMFAIIVIYMLFTYTFESLSIFKMSRNLEYKGAISAWIPFYNK